MNYKVIILISLSFIGVSFTSWKMISQKQKKNLKNNYQSLHDKKKEALKEIVFKEEEKNNSFLLLMIIVIIILLIIIIFVISYKIYQNKGLIIKQNNISENNQNKYQKFKCGLSLGSCNEYECISVIFGQVWNSDAFFDQLWKLDVEYQYNKNKEDPFYQDAMKQETKDKIKEFFKLIIQILNIIDYQFLCRVAGDSDNGLLQTMANSAIIYFKGQQNLANDFKFKMFDKEIEEGNVKFKHDNVSNYQDLFDQIKNHNSLSFFKQIMKDCLNMKVCIIFENDNKKKCFFRYFISLFYFLINLQISIIVFLNKFQNEADNMFRQNIRDYEKKIERFLEEI